MSAVIRFLVISLPLVVIAASPSAGEEIYKWVDKNGAVHFSNNPSDVPQSGQKMVLPDAPKEYGKARTDQGNPSGAEGPKPYVSKYLARDDCRREVGIKESQTQAELDAINNRIFFLGNDIRRKDKDCAAERRRFSLSTCQQDVFELRSELSRLNNEKSSKFDYLSTLRKEYAACNSITD